ncbi:carbamate kinase [Candidatus Woesearchaeota archaeon]|nr:carbamate kinase [Candidatus Woesearchaeota archaeon]
MKKTIVVALGGNAILAKGQKPSISGQFSNVKKAISQILPLFKDHNLIITHGNGPQVGNIMIRVEEALGKAYTLPLEVCVAESEGEIGYIIDQCLLNAIHEKGVNASVATLLTQVVVDKNDGAFREPTKPVGPFYSKKQADSLKRKGLPVVLDAGRGYRRVVPSPKPEKIIESAIIRKLVKQNTIVIAAGGGGIPVIEEKNIYKGVEAVIDKDLASSCLAKSARANTLLILTGVDSVKLNYKKRSEKSISKMDINTAIEYMKEGHFPPGSMGPKIQAAIDFLENGGDEVIITSPENAEKAVRGNAGTHIVKEIK